MPHQRARWFAMTVVVGTLAEPSYVSEINDHLPYHCTCGRGAQRMCVYHPKCVTHLPRALPAKRSFTAKTIPGGSGKQRFPMRRTRIRGGPCPSAGLRNQPENMKKWRCPGLNARGTLSYLGRKAAKRFSGKNRLRFSPRRKPGQPRPRPWPRRDPLWDRRRRG